MQIRKNFENWFNNCCFLCTSCKDGCKDNYRNTLENVLTAVGLHMLNVNNKINI